MQGRNALEQALLDGNSEIADTLIAADAEPLQLEPVQEFAAACMLADRAIVERLLAADATLAERAAARQPQLIIRATELGRRAVVQLLVELGFDINHVGRLAALYQAACDGNLEPVKQLLELGAARPCMTGHPT